MSAIVAGILMAVLYAAVSGFGLPAQRASLMLLIAAVALIRRRHIDPFATVAVAAMSVFVLDPIATTTPGFYLSFSAVVVLLWFARCQKQRANGESLVVRVAKTVRQLFVMQIFLLFGLMPLTALLFHRVAFLAAPVNLVAVPLFSVVTVPFTLTGLVLGETYAPAGHFALRIAASSIQWLETMIEQLIRVPFADISIAEVQNFGWLVVVMPVLWVLLPKGWPGRWVGLLAVVALLQQAPKSPEEGCVDAHVLDVGQGLATIVQTRHSTLLFDTGASFRGGGSVADQIIVPFLKSRGIRRIDWLVVSHADNDHSGGVRAINEYAEVGAMLVGESLRDVDLAASDCVIGQRWRADNVSFRILHPDPARPRQGNDSSCVVLVEAGGHGLLLTGDIEADAELELVEKNRLATVDVIVVPHHGSLTSSSMPLVDAASPMLAIVSAGYANRWGFPKDRVVKRWQSVGARVLSTATSGAVSLRLCTTDGLRAVRTDRYQRHRFWREAAN